MKRRYILSLSLLMGFGIFSLFSGMLLGIIFLLIWIDKILLGVMELPGRVGIELITISTVLLGIGYGPVVGFLFALIMIPLVEGVKYEITKIPSSDWPPFVPSPDHFADAAIAVLASLLVGMNLLLIMVICLAVKGVLKYFSALMIGKPPDFLNIIFSFAFNVFIVVYAGAFITGILPHPVPGITGTV